MLTEVKVLLELGAVGPEGCQAARIVAKHTILVAPGWEREHPMVESPVGDGAR